jgi:hypothetical protein
MKPKKLHARINLNQAGGFPDSPQEKALIEMAPWLCFWIVVFGIIWCVIVVIGAAIAPIPLLLN